MHRISKYTIIKQCPKKKKKKKKKTYSSSTSPEAKTTYFTSTQLRRQTEHKLCSFKIHPKSNRKY